MAGRIPQDFIDNLLSRSDIVEVIDQRIPLKKAGKEFEACCPFHGEKTPSFKVSPSKQFYHCFGCGVHGTVLGFLMDYERLEFREAIELLAERAGLPIPETASGSEQQRDYGPVYEVLRRADAYYRRQLREHRDAKKVVDYLKGRGLSGEIARDFGLGFAPAGWTNLSDALGKDEATLKHLEVAGLISKRSDASPYDRFRGRVMFPIHDRRGRVIGFGGRVLGDDGPKYLNSPETPLFHKGRELYGRWQALRRGGRLERLIVVEGYMDVVALAQNGLTNAVATLGTAATEDHLENLFRLTPEVVFCFDGDTAGRRAAWRALENTLPQMRDGRRASFMFLPEGEDPDSLVREQGPERFGALVAQAANLSDYLFEHLTEGLDLASIEGRSQLYKTATPLLEKLPQGAFQALAFARLAELSGVESPRGKRGNAAAVRARSTPTSARTSRTKETGSGRLLRRAIALLLHQPQMAAEFLPTEGWRDDGRPGASLLAELVELLAANPHLSSGAVVERYRDHPMGKHLASLAATPLDLEEGLERELRDCIASLHAQNRRARTAERLRVLTAKGSRALTEAERRELLELTRLGAGSTQG